MVFVFKYGTCPIMHINKSPFDMICWSQIVLFEEYKINIDHMIKIWILNNQNIDLIDVVVGNTTNYG